MYLNARPSMASRFHWYDGRAWGRYGWVLLALGLFVVAQARADWQLDNNASSLSFVSIKNESIAEAHTFTNLTGLVDNAGSATVHVSLDNVETLIPIRNERLRSLLFMTDEFPSAKVSTTLDLKPLLTLADGENLLMDLNLSLSLHGVEVTKMAAVRVFRLPGQVFQVSSVKPLLINGHDFALNVGLEALREIAKLQAITPVVPVSFNLVFRQTE